MAEVLFAPIEILLGALWTCIMLYIYFCIARWIWRKFIRGWLLKEMFKQSEVTTTVRGAARDIRQ